MRLGLLTLLPLMFAISALAALPGNSGAGKTLHDASCVSCHDSGVYTRTDRRIDSLASLRTQVQACGHAAKINLSSDEQQNLVKYLNEQFYKFK
jgi:hypothetical protein